MVGDIRDVEGGERRGARGKPGMSGEKGTAYTHRVCFASKEQVNVMTVRGNTRVISMSNRIKRKGNVGRSVYIAVASVKVTK